VAWLGSHIDGVPVDNRSRGRRRRGLIAWSRVVSCSSVEGGYGEEVVAGLAQEVMDESLGDTLLGFYAPTHSRIDPCSGLNQPSLHKALPDPIILLILSLDA
jgi:hypothetical protein